MLEQIVKNLQKRIIDEKIATDGRHGHLDISAFILSVASVNKAKAKAKAHNRPMHPSQKTERVPTSQERSEPEQSRTQQRPQRPVPLEDLFNPNKLRDILGVPQ